MRIAEALRGLLIATNDKAYRDQADQDRVSEAHAALADWDHLMAQLPQAPAQGTVAPPVADQRAAFIDALQWGRE